jgi:GNAT superfamily N-acetyltransferase
MTVNDRKAKLQIVPFGERHLATFTAWFNALPHNDLWTAAWVREKSLDDATYDPALMIAAEMNGEPVGFLLGSIANDTGWIRAFVVREDRRRRGIGTLLVETVEARFKARGITDVTVGWALPRYFLPGVDVTYTDAIVFLDRHGYETDRATRVNMDVDLVGQDFGTDADAAQLREVGIVTRRARAEDEEGITALCLSQGHDGWAAETGLALRKSPVPVFVALKAGTVCAFATHSLCGPVHFGPMLTHEGLRGMGIGSVLLKDCLRDWQAAGIARCEITWAGPLSFYARSVGATMGKCFWSYHKAL